MSAQNALALDDPTRPTQPTWFDTQAGQEDRLTFADLAELARHVVRLAAGRGLRISAAPLTTCAVGFSPFPAWSIYLLTDDGGEDWLGHAAVQDIGRDRLEAAITTARGAGQARAA